MSEDSEIGDKILNLLTDPRVIKASIPEGWYDSCFPTKELHDQWFANLRDPQPMRGCTAPLVYVDDYAGFDRPQTALNGAVLDMFDQWKKAVNPDLTKDHVFQVRISPGRVPSKKDGRKGTRRNWKRQNPPQIVNYVWKVDTSSIVASSGYGTVNLTLNYSSPTEEQKGW